MEFPDFEFTKKGGRLKDTYKKHKVIGKGSFGEVWTVSRIGHNTLYVAKCIATLDDDRDKMAHEEAKMLQSLKHPHVVRYLDDVEEMDRMFIVTEYCAAGDFNSISRKMRTSGNYFSETEIQNICFQTLLALQYLHGNKKYHRDIKPHNLFLTAKGIVKVGDFGISRSVSRENEAVWTYCGTTQYMSPQMILKTPYTGKSDIWSLGMTLIHLMQLESPFTTQPVFQQLSAITEKPILVVDPKERYSAELKSIVQDAMLAKREENRLSADELLRLPYFAELAQQKEPGPLLRLCQILEAPKQSEASCGDEQKISQSPPVQSPVLSPRSQQHALSEEIDHYVEILRQKEYKPMNNFGGPPVTAQPTAEGLMSDENFERWVVENITDIKNRNTIQIGLKMISDKDIDLPWTGGKDLLPGEPVSKEAKQQALIARLSEPKRSVSPSRRNISKRTMIYVRVFECLGNNLPKRVESYVKSKIFQAH